MEIRKSVMVMQIVKVALILFAIHYSLFAFSQTKREMRGAWIQCVN